MFPQTRQTLSGFGAFTDGTSLPFTERFRLWVSRVAISCRGMVSGLAQIFVPMSSQSRAKGDLDGLRKIFIVGNRACAFIIFPMTAVLTVLSKCVMEAWVGPKYVATSYPVLLVLIIRRR
jgi:hypothetical protein